MNLNQSSPASSTSPNSTTAPDFISRRAYEIWEQEGRPEGCELQHWLQAEQELTRAASSSATSSAGVDGTSAPPTTDARPLQGTRAGGAANRDRRSSGSPFPGDKGNGRSPTTARR